MKLSVFHVFSSSLFLGPKIPKPNQIRKRLGKEPYQVFYIFYIYYSNHNNNNYTRLIISSSNLDKSTFENPLLKSVLLMPLKRSPIV